MRYLPAQGIIGFRFGSIYPPSFGSLAGKRHLGTDIKCPVGTPVVAPIDGVIFALVNGKEGGFTVQLKGTDGWYYRMMHNSQFKVKKGDTVKAGQLVALSGGQPGAPGAGTTSAPHCHADRSKILNSQNFNDYSDLEKWVKEEPMTVNIDNTRALVVRIYKKWLKIENPVPSDIEAQAAFMRDYLNAGNEADADKQFADFEAGAPSGGSNWAVIKQKIIDFINSL